MEGEGINTQKKGEYLDEFIQTRIYIPRPREPWLNYIPSVCCCSTQTAQTDSSQVRHMPLERRSNFRFLHVVANATTHMVLTWVQGSSELVPGLSARACFLRSPRLACFLRLYKDVTFPLWSVVTCRFAKLNIRQYFATFDNCQSSLRSPPPLITRTFMNLGGGIVLGDGCSEDG